MYADLRTGPEPFRRRQRLEDGQPHDRAAREEAEMLERVHASRGGRPPRTGTADARRRGSPPTAAGRRTDWRGSAGGTGSASAGRRIGPVSPARSASGARSPSRTCWSMWKLKSCSPSAWIGLTRARRAGVAIPVAKKRSASRHMRPAGARVSAHDGRTALPAGWSERPGAGRKSSSCRRADVQARL